jgi:predicted O-linked N-acetylglucosamine transferase (SPINDLY family)
MISTFTYRAFACCGNMRLDDFAAASFEPSPLAAFARAADGCVRGSVRSACMVCPRKRRVKPLEVAQMSARLAHRSHRASMRPPRNSGIASMLSTWKAFKSVLADVAASALMRSGPSSPPAVGRGLCASLLKARGDNLRDLARPLEALACYDRALQLTPGNAAAFYKRGNALMMLNRPAEAALSYSDALLLANDYGDAFYNRGLALQLLKRPAEALADFNEALRLKPDDADGLNNRGNVLLELKRPVDALACYDRALSLKPSYSQALHNRSLALLDLKRPDEAARSLATLLELEPDYPFAKGKLLHAKMLACDWAGLRELSAVVATDVRNGKQAAEPFGYQAIAESSADLQTCARNYAAGFYPAGRTPMWAGEKYNHSKIRIGYVAGEFREQATAFLITELFELHDKNRFELYAFDNGWDDGSDIRQRINCAFDQIIPIANLPDEAAAGLIRQNEIDILVNLNGYFGQARQGVFSLRPSPVQVSFLGFPGTTGVEYIDYIIADRCVIPLDQQAYYDENVVYLPDAYQVNDSRRRIAAMAPTRSEAGLPENGFVFCCFNNNYKITPGIFNVWMRLLERIPDSVLWLYEDSAVAAKNLLNIAVASGISSERLIFARNAKLPEHLARHRLADLFLDTLPCNAHTTASDALWAGLPILTCRGSTFTGRVAASLLDAIGLPELITENLAQYEALAVELARAPSRLWAIRAKLKNNRDTHPLFDTRRFRGHIESAYITMWERYQRGEPPAGFEVTPIALH